MKFSFTKKNILIISIIIIIIVLAITLPLVLLKKTSSNNSILNTITTDTTIVIPSYTKIYDIQYKFSDQGSGVISIDLSWEPPVNQADSRITGYTITHKYIDYKHTEQTNTYSNHINFYTINNLELGPVYDITISGNNPKNYNYSSQIIINSNNIGQWYDSNNNKVDITQIIANERKATVSELVGIGLLFLYSYDPNNRMYFIVNNVTYDTINKNPINPPIRMADGSTAYKINQIIDETTKQVLYTYRL